MRAILKRARAAATAGIAAGLAAFAAACSAGDADDGTRVAVVAAAYPLEEAARRVGGDRVSVTGLTPPGVEPHDLELTADDIEAIATADVVVYVGRGFQPAVEEAVAEARGLLLDALDGIDTLPPPDGEHASSADPHVWLDPRLFADVVERLARALADADPADAEAFAANADAFVAELRRVDAAYRSALSGCRGRTMVVNHAAFGYLAAAYDLEQAAISGVSPEAEPDPRRLAELRDLVEREGVTTIFTEELVPDDVARTLAEEAGVSMAVLSPLESLTPDQADAGEDYRSVMLRNLDVLREGLGCDG